MAAAPLVGTLVERDEVPLAIDELTLVALLGACAEGETVVRVPASFAQGVGPDRRGGGRAARDGRRIEAVEDGFVVNGDGSPRHLDARGTIDSHGRPSPRRLDGGRRGGRARLHRGRGGPLRALDVVGSMGSQAFNRRENVPRAALQHRIGAAALCAGSAVASPPMVVRDRRPRRGGQEHGRAGGRGGTRLHLPRLRRDVPRGGPAPCANGEPLASRPGALRIELGGPGDRQRREVTEAIRAAEVTEAASRVAPTRESVGRCGKQRALLATVTGWPRVATSARWSRPTRRSSCSSPRPRGARPAARGRAGGRCGPCCGPGAARRAGPTREALTASQGGRSDGARHHRADGGPGGEDRGAGGRFSEDAMTAGVGPVRWRRRGPSRRSLPGWPSRLPQRRASRRSSTASAVRARR